MATFSVIIASVNGLPTIAECIAAILAQECDADFEIIVIDRTTNGTDKYIEQNFPQVKLIKADKNTGIPQLRAIGMQQATGDFFVITEDHCIVPKNWLSGFLAAHRNNYEVVGGSVENSCQSTLTDWATFLCEYSSFMPPIISGEAEFVAGNNVSYKREAVESIENDLKSDYWEYFLQNELQQRNFKFFSDNSILIFHKKEFSFFYFLSQRYYYSRSFAAMRRTKSTFIQQLKYLVYAPIAPFHLTWRILQNVRRKNRNAREFWLSLPMLFVFMIVYAFGELIGQLFGAGNSLSKVE